MLARNGMEGNVEYVLVLRGSMQSSVDPQLGPSKQQRSGCCPRLQAAEWEQMHGDRTIEEQPNSSTPVASVSRTRDASATEIVGATRTERGFTLPEDGTGEGEGDHHLVGGEEQAERPCAQIRDPPIELSSEAVIKRVAQRLEGYRLPSDRVEKLRDTLNLFRGTKNYHNYTNSKKGGDSSCNRWGGCSSSIGLHYVRTCYFAPLIRGPRYDRAYA